MKIQEAKGFSLVELIIVIAIFGIVLAFAVPNFMSYRQNTNLKEAARDISSDIYNCRQRASGENLHYRMVFAANTYTIQRETAVNSNAYIDLNVKNVGAGNSAVAILGIPSFSGGVPFITFQPRGTMSAGSLTLQHSNRLSTAAITTNLMGRANVQYDLK